MSEVPLYGHKTMYSGPYESVSSDDREEEPMQIVTGSLAHKKTTPHRTHQ